MATTSTFSCCEGNIFAVMNYSECLDFLYNTLPMFSRTGHTALKEGLGNTEAICRYLGQPERTFKCIHIAGTNGKGSVSHMMASVLQSAGYNTGLYTSPHLSDFRERIRVNGQMIDKSAVVAFTKKITPLITQLQPSFFEITVGMAFDHFSNEKVDVAVIETGLGGRLDSTNVIMPELSIITNIGFDHMQILGNTLEKIAFEKAGIIKPHRPIVIGKSCDQTKDVFINKAKIEQSALLFAEELTKTVLLNSTPEMIEVEIIDHVTKRAIPISCDLPGIYQVENIATAYTALSHLNKKGWTISEENIKQGIGNTKKYTGLFGRWELISKNPTLVADVAHNSDGIRNIIRQVALSDHENLFIILGVSKEKDVNNILALLPKSATYGFTQANIPRALDKNLLQEMAFQYGLNGEVYTDVNEAIRSLIPKATPKDLIIVCGSVFVVGEIAREEFP